MDPMDREILAPRHFEQLGNPDVAQTLGISKSLASSRYLRALKRLRGSLIDIPGLWDAERASPMDDQPRRILRH